MKKIYLAAAAAVLVCSLSVRAQEMRTAQEIAAEMAPGWNLGNTLEGTRPWAGAALFNNKGGVESETAWQSTRTTPEIIQYVKAQGFRSVRIPCAWAFGHIADASDYTIDEAWMNRVHEIVDYCLDEGLYVILNDHWDGGWLENNIGNNSSKQKNKEILKRLWNQIAESFADYDDHLLFAGLNEPNASNAAETANLLELERVFIDAVRETGGNNASRVLVVQGPNTDISNTYLYYDSLPDDSAPDRLIMEVHYYTPWQFCGMTKDESWGRYVNYWGEGYTPAGSNRGYKDGEEEMHHLFGLMKEKFTDYGIPVIIGEYACNWKYVREPNDDQAMHDSSVKHFYKELNTLCRQYGMISYAWDTNNPVRPTSTIIDRKYRQIYGEPMLEGIREAYSNSGIENVAADGENDDPAWYTIQGIRLDRHPDRPGLYIHKGRKILLR